MLYDYVCFHYFATNLLVYKICLAWGGGGCQNHQPRLVCICVLTDNENMLSHLQHHVSSVLETASSSKESAVSLSHSQQPCVHSCTTGRTLLRRMTSTHKFNSSQKDSFNAIVLRIVITVFGEHHFQMCQMLVHQSR